MRTLSFIILFISKNVRLEDTTEINEFEENTTKVYDVIIDERDREINEIVINEIDNGNEDNDEDEAEDEEKDTEGQRVGEDANKLLAAQVNAVHVLNMIKDLEEDMKVFFKK